MNLSVLRDIGWSEWDPIGLREGDWRDMDGPDEYDRYLLHAAVRLQRGEADDAVIAWLIEAETGHIGIAGGPTTQSRATATVAAIKAYVRTLV